MEPGALLDRAAADARSLLAAASTRWDAPVPHCPGWDAAELVRHQGSIFSWMATIVTGRRRVSRRELAPGPAEPAELPGWYLGNLDQVTTVLGSADPQSATWTFSSTGDQRVAWWDRRLAVEVAIHRFDAEHAVAADDGSPAAPLDGDVAAAGIEEFITEFLPGLLAQAGGPDLKGTLHLHATDGPVEWWIDLGAAGAARPQHAKADTAIRGTRGDLLLWLTNRTATGALEILGRPEIADRWQQLRR
ncbi:MAG TPA: maleylpyruvate isomerase N-terminal domain-containing protein [Streptosporangiaceae bacterium]|nr:maleylpyruvate isomerase N-terminal domain-containing protein [Streptosporangiaceae bacterium]